jgi:hypothetical protein
VLPFCFQISGRRARARVGQEGRTAAGLAKQAAAAVFVFVAGGQEGRVARVPAKSSAGAVDAAVEVLEVQTAPMQAGSTAAAAIEAAAEQTARSKKAITSESCNIDRSHNHSVGIPSKRHIRIQNTPELLWRVWPSQRLLARVLVPASARQISSRFRRERTMNGETYRKVAWVVLRRGHLPLQQFRRFERRRLSACDDIHFPPSRRRTERLQRHVCQAPASMYRRPANSDLLILLKEYRCLDVFGVGRVDEGGRGRWIISGGRRSVYITVHIYNLFHRLFHDSLDNLHVLLHRWMLIAVGGTIDALLR